MQVPAWITKALAGLELFSLTADPAQGAPAPFHPATHPTDTRPEKFDVDRFPAKAGEVVRVEQDGRVDFYRQVEALAEGERAYYVAKPIPLPDPYMGDTIVYFDHNVRTPQAGSENILGPIAKYLLENPDVSITLTAHADRSGEVAYNQTLSEDRAANVEAQMIAELEKLGITDAARRVRTAVSSSAHGENDNAVATDDGVREPLNRRVTVSFSYADPAELEKEVTHHYLVTNESCRNITFSPTVSAAFQRQMEEQHRHFVIRNGYGEVVIEDNQREPANIRYEGFTDETRDHFKFLTVGGTRGVYGLEAGETPQQAQMTLTLPNGDKRVVANFSVPAGEDIGAIQIGLTAPGQDPHLMNIGELAMVTPGGIEAIATLPFGMTGSEVAGPDSGSPQTPGPRGTGINGNGR